MNINEAPTKSLLQHDKDVGRQQTKKEVTTPVRGGSHQQSPAGRLQRGRRPDRPDSTKSEAPPGFGPPEEHEKERKRSMKQAIYPLDFLWGLKDLPDLQTCINELPAALDKKNIPGSSRAHHHLEMEFERRMKKQGNDDNETPEWFGRDDDLNQEYSFKVLDNDDKAYWHKHGTVKNDVSVLSLRDYEKKERRMNQNLHKKDDKFNLVDQPFDSNDILEALRKDREALAASKQGTASMDMRGHESRKAQQRRLEMEYRMQNGTDPSTLAYASRTATQLMKQQLSLLGYSFVPTQAQRLQLGGISQDERERLLWEESQRKIYIQAIAEASLIQEQRNQAALRKIKRQREKHALIFG